MRSRVNEEVSCRRLEIFLAYMQYGSLTSAGAALDASPVSVHRALHALEEGMRCSLFRHEGRRLIPNEAAHVLAKVAEDVVGRLERGVEASSGRGKRGLEIEVFDVNTGKARPTATLSGGETFISALALALGLADVVESLSGKIRMDTIFIDEGFGSLDSENGAGTLDQVLQVLSALTKGNRAVGLISHVGLVQEAIPQGFYVRSTPSGSRVEERRGL